MTDLERVLQGLDCISGFRHCLQSEAFAGGICAYCMKEIAKKAKELLKEQEAKPMTEYDDGWDCPRCGLKLIGKTASGYPCDVLDLPNDEIVKYCPVCGQAVTWND